MAKYAPSGRKSMPTANPIQFSQSLETKFARKNDTRMKMIPKTSKSMPEKIPLEKSLFSFAIRSRAISAAFVFLCVDLSGTTAVPLGGKLASELPETRPSSDRYV